METYRVQPNKMCKRSQGEISYKKIKKIEYIFFIWGFVWGFVFEKVEFKYSFYLNFISGKILYRKKRNIVKIEKQKVKESWMEKKLEKDCPLSSLLVLFNIYVINLQLEEEMKKEQTGGIIDRKKAVLITRIEQNFKGIQEIFRKKCLVLSSEKSKIMMFENGKDRR